MSWLESEREEKRAAADTEEEKGATEERRDDAEIGRAEGAANNDATDEDNDEDNDAGREAEGREIREDAVARSITCTCPECCPGFSFLLISA